jgi:2-dehydro-3-deoxygalactonokinase
MKKFISCDWGTSAFRIRLIDSDHLEVIAEVTTGDGISNTYHRWVETHRPSEERLMFYMNYLQDQLHELKKQTGLLLHDIPVIISGMASSTIGMIELPYKKLPFHVDGHDLHVRLFSDGKLIIVSGACTENDVLRGEETMLIGCLPEKSNTTQLMIFPGTHSKHIEVKAGKAVRFQTYMTGEFFDLLSNRSILSNSVQKPSEAEDYQAFDEGVRYASKGNLLHEVFAVRTNQVLNKMSRESNYSFLSGLLIGAELKDIRKSGASRIVLISGSNLKRQYLRALHSLVPDDHLEFRDADQALIRGHQLICQHFAN